jgi:Fe-S-cluster containining protein
VDSNVCQRHDCHVCCLDTIMTLTEADVSVLEEAGYSDFVRLNTNGDLELKNQNGQCVFLQQGRCSVYEIRPDGCRLFPLILDMRSDRVVRDEFCPHWRDFPIDATGAAKLRRSVALETAEAERRRRNSG